MAEILGSGGITPLLTLVQGRGTLTLEVVAVEVRQVFTEGCRSPRGLRPTWGLVMGPHMAFVLWNSGSQAVMADRRACLGW